jgi:thiamine pyrophosphokinase
MKNNRIVIVANGNLTPDFLKEIKLSDIVIGVDRAAYWLIENGVIPGVAVGDFDSTSKKEFEIIKKNVPIVRSFQPEKDYTDTELAVRYVIQLKPASVTIYGGSGTRLDHTLGALYILELCRKSGIPAVFRDRTNEAIVIGRGRTILEKRTGYPYVSVLPVSNSIQISLSGFKYELVKKTIFRGRTIGISNEFSGSRAEITLHRGLALIVQSRD